jgi:hypothetical protein
VGIGYFIRRHGDTCSVVGIHADGREEVLENGLTLADAETLYLVCIGDPVTGPSLPDAVAHDDCRAIRHRRLRQLAFKL